MVAGVVVVTRSRETYTRTGRPIVAGVAFVIEELRDLYVYWESYCMDIIFITVEPLLTDTSLLQTISYVPTKFSLICFKEKPL